MKKNNLLFTSLLASLALSGCGNGDNSFTPTSVEEDSSVTSKESIVSEETPTSEEVYASSSL